MKKIGCLAMYFMVLIILFSGCQLTVEEKCETWLKVRDECFSEESGDFLEVLQKGAECQKEADRRIGLDKLNELEQREFLDYCTKKIINETFGPALGKQLQEQMQKNEQQNKEYLESTKGKIQECKKYIPSLKKFCPNALEVEPTYLSYKNPPPALAIFFQNSHLQELESCSWRVDIGADPIRYASPYETNSLVISITTYPSIEVAADRFSIMATQTKNMIDVLEECDGEVQSDFFSSSCSNKLTSPGDEGKLVKNIQVQTYKDELMIAARVDFGDNKTPVCSASEIKNLVQSFK